MAYNPVDFIPVAKPFGPTHFPLDPRCLFYDKPTGKLRAYVSTAEVLSYLPLQFRGGYFDIIVNSGGTLSNGVITGGENSLYWFKKGGVTGELPVLKQVDFQYMVNAEIGVAPPSSAVVANVSAAGTYPLYDGLVVTTDDLSAGQVQFRRISGTWIKFLTPIDLRNYVKKSDLDYINAELFTAEVLGNGVFTGETTSSQTLNRCVINQRKQATKIGVVQSLKIRTGTIGNVNLIQLRKSGSVYNSVGSYPFSLVTGTQTFNLLDLNIDVKKGDTFGIQIQTNGNVQAIVEAGHNWSSASVDPVGGVISFTAGQVEGNSGNNVSFFFDVTIRNSSIKDLNSSVAELQVKSLQIDKNATDISILTDSLSLTDSKVNTFFTDKDIPVDIVDSNESTGWDISTFAGWSVGFKFAAPGGSFRKVRMILSKVNSNDHLHFEIYRRPIANENASGIGAYPGSLSGDILLQSIDFPVSGFLNTASMQSCDFVFNPIVKSTAYIYLINVKAIATGGAVGVLGSGRHTSTPGTLKQYEQGWYVNAVSGAVNSINTATSGFRVARIVYELQNVNRLDIAELNIAKNTLDITDINNRMPPPKTSKGTILFSDSLTSITSNWVNNGWLNVAGGVSPSGVGLANFIKLNKQYGIDRRSARTVVRFGSSTRFLLYTLNQEGNNNLCTISECDVSAGQLRIYQAYGGSTTTLPSVSSNMAFTFLTDRDYIVELILNKNLFSHILRVTDTVTGLVTSLEDTTKNAGRQHDCYAMTCYSGSIPIIKTFTVSTPIKSPFVFVLGDSISEAMGNGVPSPLSGYAQALVSAVSGDGAVSGRGGGSIAGVINRIETEAQFIKPTYGVVMIGTNGGNTLVNLRQVVQRLIDLGIKPILNNIPMNSTSVAARNSDISTVRSEFGISGALMDVATAINNNPTNGQDTSLFYPDLVHPLNFGNPFMFNRFKIDTPELLY